MINYVIEDTATLEREQVAQTDKGYTAWASDLRWAPGGFPGEVLFAGDSRPFRLTNLTAKRAKYYQRETGLQLLVWND